MTLLIQFSLLPILGLTFYQDWKYRAVSILIFPVLLGLSYTIFYLLSGQKIVLILNTFFLASVMLSLFVYVSLRRKKITNIFKDDFGLGDVLFFAAIIPLFANQNYVLFFITGMLLSGCIHLVLFRKKDNPKIPLAGYLSLYLMLWITVNILTQGEFLYTELIGWN